MRAVARRAGNLAGFVVCATLVGWAVLYAQGVLELEPCPLCIFQRVGLSAVGALFLLAGLHHPRGWGARVYGALIALAAALTAAVSIRHLWIQAQPEGTVAACGATLDYMLDVFPLTDVIRKVLTGSGECAKVTWRLLGLSMPAWVLMAAVGLGAGGVLLNWRPRRD